MHYNQESFDRDSRKAKAFENSLLVFSPKIAAEWHPTRNGFFSPSHVTKSSKTKIWWLCPEGHEYQARIYSRTYNKNGCPYCSGQAVLQGYNDLATVEPGIASEWHPTKNNYLKPTDVTKCSIEKAWWICSEGHEYQAKIYNRTAHKTGCPFCSGKSILPGYNDLVTVEPGIASEWHPNKNNNLKPTDVTKCSNKKVWWSCPEGHEYQARICDRTCDKTGCPFCSGQFVLQGYNDLATVEPGIASEWHPNKNNNLKPSDVTRCSAKKVWWICTEGHEYQAKIYNRTKNNTGCPFCSGYKTTVKDSFAFLYPNLLNEWIYVCNYPICSPYEISPQNDTRVFWKCMNDSSHSYSMSVKDRVNYFIRNKESCPYCKGLRKNKRHFI